MGRKRAVWVKRSGVGVFEYGRGTQQELKEWNSALVGVRRQIS